LKITNLFGLPKALVNAVSVRPHNDPGSLSATTLLKSMKQILLTERHWDELEEDVLDRFWALFGSAIHIIRREMPGFRQRRILWLY
jgi:hypothetical protein